METLTLTAPEVQPQIVTADYRVRRLVLDVEGAIVLIQLRGTNGEAKEFLYEGSVARTLITGLNTANLSTKSLQRRILERLVADGKFAGSVTGTPD